MTMAMVKVVVKAVMGMVKATHQAVVETVYPIPLTTTAVGVKIV